LRTRAISLISILTKQLVSFRRVYKSGPRRKYRCSSLRDVRSHVPSHTREDDRSDTRSRRRALHRPRLRDWTPKTTQHRRVKVLKIIDTPRIGVIDGTGAFSTASAKLLRNRGFPVNYIGHAQAMGRPVGFILKFVRPGPSLPASDDDHKVELSERPCALRDAAHPQAALPAITGRLSL
jgi:hypothetical protein